MVGFILLFCKGKENLLELAMLHGALTKLGTVKRILQRY